MVTSAESDRLRRRVRVVRLAPCGRSSDLGHLGDEARNRLVGEFVVEQPAETVAAAEAIELRRFAARRPPHGRLRERRLLGERAVRPVFVLVLRVDAHDMLEMPAAED
jgi:hypothetical protein